MAGIQVVDRVRDAAARIAAGYGLNIFDVQYRRESGGMVLRVLIDRLEIAVGEGVSVEDCARVSRDLSAVLDVEDLVPGKYTLEVSSPGLDRPLRDEADYRRFVGRRAKLVMRHPVEGQGYFKGRLAGVEGAPEAPVVAIETDDGRRHVVPLAVITRANLEVEF